MLAIAGLAIAVEEALWRLSSALAWLGRLPALRSVECRVRSAPPPVALALFCVPSAALAPVKLLALYWLAGGHPVLGIGVILTAKIAGTALVARLFQLTRPQLLSYAWFRWLHDSVLHLRQAAYVLWWNSAPGRLWRRTRDRRRAWIHRRWSAARAWFRRK